MRQLGEYMGVTSLACIGGGRVGADIEKLRAGVQVVVGTPGRIFDLLKRRALRVNSLFYVILDEADEMLSGNFKDQAPPIAQSAECRTTEPNTESRSRRPMGAIPTEGTPILPVCHPGCPPRFRSTTSSKSCRRRPQWASSLPRCPTRCSTSPPSAPPPPRPTAPHPGMRMHVVA